MKRLLWCLKAVFLCATLFALSTGYTSPVTAQDEGMGVEVGALCGDPCERSTTNQCFCVLGTCQGCYIANGTGGCGTCSYR